MFAYHLCLDASTLESWRKRSRSAARGAGWDVTVHQSTKGRSLEADKRHPLSQGRTGEMRLSVAWA